MNSKNHTSRAAFTLIELLVVITLIMILAGMAAAFIPAMGNNARQAQGGTMLQQWILTAKQKALRDQVPCGLRLIATPFVDPSTGASYSQVTQCLFIEQPDDFPLSLGSTLRSVPGNLSQVSISLNLSNQVASGDYLEVLGNGLMHLVFVPPPPGANPTTLTLNSPLPFAIQPTTQYRIVRAPRVTGDDALQMPDSIVIDTFANTHYAGAGFGGALPPPPSRRQLRYPLFPNRRRDFPGRDQRHHQLMGARGGSQ